MLASEAPPPWLLPKELDEVEDEKMADLLVAMDAVQRERVEQERAEPPLSSTRLELFSRPPP